MRYIIQKIILFTLTILVFVGCNNDPAPNKLALEIEYYFDSLASHHNFSGAILYKQNEDIILKKAYGYANYNTKRLFKTNTQMEIASVSKQFTSMAIMLLREKGKLLLDTPVNNYLKTPLPYEEITVRHLLSHTSGLPEYEDYFYSEWPIDKPCYNQDIVEYYISNRPELLFDPGSSFKYSNGGYIILAEVVNFVGGEPLDSFLANNIFNRYGFQKTGFVERNTILTRDNYAPGYYYNADEDRFVLPDSIPGKEYVSFLSYRLGPGRLSSTIEDLALWDSLLKTDSLLSKKSIIELFTPQYIENVESNYALGWRVNMDTLIGWHTYHTGSWAGNKTYISRFINSPKNWVSNKTYNIENEETDYSLPDQTIIIFNNNHIPQIKSAYNYCDSIIINSRNNRIAKKDALLENSIETPKGPLIKSDPVVLGILFVILALVFYTSSLSGKFWKRFYTFIPSILLCYFLPGLLNTFDIISGKESALYDVASRYFLPASLVLLTLTIDLKSMWKLGYKAIIMFLAGAIGIIIGGPLTILIISFFNPDFFIYNTEEVWRGMTTIAGSWIGGGANQAAMLEIFHPSKELFSQMLAVDVLIANIWMAILLFFVPKSKKIDDIFKADASSIVKMQNKIQEYEKKITRVALFPDIMIILGVGFGITGIAHLLSGFITPWLQENYPQLERYSLTNNFFWIIIISTTLGVMLSFTKIKKLEGVGASKFGSAFLFFLVATIGMNIDLKYLIDNPHFFLIGAVWILFHIGTLILVAWLIKAPYFFIAVGSQANIGGPVSAPIVASAFNPGLAPIGVLLAVFGYAIGTYGAYFCGLIMQMVN